MNKDLAEVRDRIKTAEAAAQDKRSSAKSTRAKRAARTEAERIAHFKRGMNGSY